MLAMQNDESSTRVSGQPTYGSMAVNGRFDREGRVHRRAGTKNGAQLAISAVVIGAAVAACGGHSEAWQDGYEHRHDAVSLISSGVSNESACRSVAGFGFGRENGQIKEPDAYDGCMAGVRDEGH
jgi:hypothetical protein